MPASTLTNDRTDRAIRCITQTDYGRKGTQRIYDLPDKREELHKKGYSDEEIKNMEKDSSLVDAEVSAELDRMIELINYKHKQ